MEIKNTTNEETLFDEHENMESGHSWAKSYTKIRLADGIEALTFSGLKCTCGAFIQSEDMSSIINHYYGNRIHLSVIKCLIHETQPPRII